ncbi:hypothetical protein E4U03_07100 [Rothia nasimurium]|uniref:Uncharacterized protein n=1 Tax=Rothia nasimurium TaxID=85336 RepID=A0A4Y9F4P2_9MICC|nr:hypothetical protein [Rothia nasimurium]MBF0808373.1 hypothetical protein [Rothia nasimurium]TFU22191.1 hypothetical protein E4U03_07100 [Rothia nasimurium]
MASTGGNWNQYHDYASQSLTGSVVHQNLTQDPEAKRKLKLVNDGLAQNLAHQKALFRIIILIVVGSLLAIVLTNACAAIWGTNLDAAVLISFNASIAVQSFLLLNVIARSLFPAPTQPADEKSAEK